MYLPFSCLFLSNFRLFFENKMFFLAILIYPRFEIPIYFVFTSPFFFMGNMLQSSKNIEHTLTIHNHTSNAYTFEINLMKYLFRFDIDYLLPICLISNTFSCSGSISIDICRQFVGFRYLLSIADLNCFFTDINWFDC